MERILEIKAAEGGADSRIFVEELAIAYQKLANMQGWLDI